MLLFTGMKTIILLDNDMSTFYHTHMIDEKDCGLVS